MKQNKQLCESVAQTGLNINQLVKCLMAQRTVSRHRANTDRAVLHRLSTPHLSKHIVDRIGNFYPLRIFYPVFNRFRKYGKIDQVLFSSELKLVNDKVKFLSNLEEARDRLTNTKQVFIERSSLGVALSWCLRLVFPNGLPFARPLLSLHDLLSTVNWKANSGYPHCCKKELLRDEYSGIMNNWLMGRHSLKIYLNNPMLIFNRTQVKEGKMKRRIVFGYPFIFTLVEAVFFTPIINAMRGNPVIFVGVTQSQISESIAKHKGKFMYSIDYSKFDQTVDVQWIYLVFELFCELLCLSGFLKQEFTFVKQYFAFGSAYHPHTGVIRRMRGVPSGSGGTNIIDSFLNLIITSYALVRLGFHSRVETMLIHGDDIVVVAKRPINIARLENELAKLGMTIKCPEPQVSNTYFLGSFWRDGKPERDYTTMSFQASTVSGLLERADTLEDAVEGRIYTIFGFDHRLPVFWRQLGFRPYIGRRLFVYSEAFVTGALVKGQKPDSMYIMGRADEWRQR